MIQEISKLIEIIIMNWNLCLMESREIIIITILTRIILIIIMGVRMGIGIWGRSCRFRSRVRIILIRRL